MDKRNSEQERRNADLIDWRENKLEDILRELTYNNPEGSFSVGFSRSSRS